MGVAAKEGVLEAECFNHLQMKTPTGVLAHAPHALGMVTDVLDGRTGMRNVFWNVFCSTATGRQGVERALLKSVGQA